MCVCGHVCVCVCVCGGQVSMNGDQYVTQSTREGRFTFHNIPSGNCPAPLTPSLPYSALTALLSCVCVCVCVSCSVPCIRTYMHTYIHSSIHPFMHSPLLPICTYLSVPTYLYLPICTYLSVPTYLPTYLFVYPFIRAFV
jgi:hypothetical protein